MALVDYTPFSTSTRRWFDDFESHMHRMQQTFLKRSFSDCGMEMPLQLISGDTSSSWKLLDDITPFKPDDIQVTIAQDGKSISLDAKSDQTTSDGGKISRAISKRWAWTGAVDANKLRCFVKDGALMIEAPQKEAPATPSVKPITVEIESQGTTKIPVHVEKSSTATIDTLKRNGTVAVSVKPVVEETVTPVQIVHQTGTRDTTVNKVTEKVAEQQEVRNATSEGTFSKVHTGSVANARRLFENIAEKEKPVSINRINESISEHKLRFTQDTPQRATQVPQSTTSVPQSTEIPQTTTQAPRYIPESSEPRIVMQIDTSKKQNMQEEKKTEQVAVSSNERIIPTTIQSGNALQTIDKSGYLSLFDDSLLSFERQFWENRVNALKRFQDTSKKFHHEFLQSIHWPNIFEDSRILRSNFNEVCKGLSVKENEITANEFKVALDVAGCPVENLSVRVSEDSRLVVEAQWRDGFTDRLARREWKLPQKISDDDVKCTISSDGILVIKVHLRQMLTSGEKKIPIMQQ